MRTGGDNQEEGNDQTPISEWRVSDNEEDLLPLTEFLLQDKAKDVTKDKNKRGKRAEKRQQGGSDDEDDLIPVSQLILRDKEIVNPDPKGIKRMSEREADECTEHSDLSDDEGSVYDSEEDRKALIQAKKKRKAVVQLGKDASKIKKK
jgi:hypothetical protein